MLRSRASYVFLGAFAVAIPSLVACSVTSTPVGAPADQTPATKESDPSPTPSTSSTTTPPTPPAKVTFEYSSVSLPAEDMQIASIGGSSSKDVWVVGTASGASSSTPYTAYHYDGASWTPMTLAVTKGRPNFGVVSLGGSDVYLGFSYSADIFKLNGTAFAKKTGFSVTSGYTMAAVGSKVYVGTQENFGAGPLYVLDGTTSKQVGDVTEGHGGVVGIWGSSESDVWLARSEGLGHIVDGVYEDTDEPAAAGVSGTAKDDVWAINASGVRHFDGKAWSDVTLPSSSDKPRTIAALSKDEVIVTTYSDVLRFDGTAFVKDTRASAPKASSFVGRIGKNEAWLTTSTGISRLAPEGT